MSGGGVDALTLFWLTYLGIFAFLMVIVVAIYVVNGFAFMALYRKVGVKPWIAWVPYYNTWTWLQLGGQPGWLALLGLVGASLVSTVFAAIGAARTQIAFRRETAFVLLAIFFPYIWAFILGSRTSVYEPWRIVAAGYPPPLVGYGSVVPNYATAPEAQPTFPTAPPSNPAPPTAPPAA